MAILREKGTTPEVSQGKIFQLEQIVRAAELGIGVDSPDKVAIVTSDRNAATYSQKLQEILA